MAIKSQLVVQLYHRIEFDGYYLENFNELSMMTPTKIMIEIIRKFQFSEFEVGITSLRVNSD